MLTSTAPPRGISTPSYPRHHSKHTLWVSRALPPLFFPLRSTTLPAEETQFSVLEPSWWALLPSPLQEYLCISPPSPDAPTPCPSVSNAEDSKPCPNLSITDTHASTLARIQHVIYLATVKRKRSTWNPFPFMSHGWWRLSAAWLLALQLRLKIAFIFENFYFRCPGESRRRVETAQCTMFKSQYRFIS